MLPRSSSALLHSELYRSDFFSANATTPSPRARLDGAAPDVPLTTRQQLLSQGEGRVHDHIPTDFWDVLLWSFWFFIWIAALMVWIRCLFDLFGDSSAVDPWCRARRSHLSLAAPVADPMLVSSEPCVSLTTVAIAPSHADRREMTACPLTRLQCGQR
jgi:hypothetical protein